MRASSLEPHSRNLLQPMFVCFLNLSCWIGTRMQPGRKCATALKRACSPSARRVQGRLPNRRRWFQPLRECAIPEPTAKHAVCISDRRVIRLVSNVGGTHAPSANKGHSANSWIGAARAQPYIAGSRLVFKNVPTVNGRTLTRHLLDDIIQGLLHNIPFFLAHRFWGLSPKTPDKAFTACMQVRACVHA